MDLLLLNGPNLNLTGRREIEIYGIKTLGEIERECCAHVQARGGRLACFQTNHEGALIDRIQQAHGVYAGVVLNAGALSHYSYALRDAIAGSGVPVVEVHMSDVMHREEFRRTDVLAPVCCKCIAGLGSRGYLEALDHFLDAECK